MAERHNYKPGTFCWPELATSDADKSKAFYGEIFNWTANDLPIPEGTYTMWLLKDKVIGAMYELTDEQKELDIPPHWISYVSVADIDETLSKLESLGGKINLGPHDVGDAGRMAFVQDPQGAAFALWEAKNSPGAQIVNDPGSLCWNELATSDAKAAESFYCALFDWTAHTQEMSMGPYTLVNNGENAAGGIMQMTEEWGDIPPHWMTYFAVDDTEAICQKVKSADGNICVEPFEVPEVGTLAVINDPQGATFSIIKLDSPDP